VCVDAMSERRERKGWGVRFLPAAAYSSTRVLRLVTFPIEKLFGMYVFPILCAAPQVCQSTTIDKEAHSERRERDRKGEPRDIKKDKQAAAI